jgi:hypothetical protein
VDEAFEKRRKDLLGRGWRILAYPDTDSFFARCQNRRKTPRSLYTPPPLSVSLKCLLRVRLFATRSVISLAHKRTEGRAPVWGSEFTKKVVPKGGFSRNQCWAKRNFVLLTAWLTGGAAFPSGTAGPDLEHQSEKFLSSAAWRAAQWQRVSLPQACRHTSAPGKTAGSPRRDFFPQAK